MTKHTYFFRHPQPFVLASFGGIQALNRKMLFSVSLSLCVSLSGTVVLSARETLPLVGLAAFKRGGVTSRCVLFKWV